jgi:hypothetical protein
MLTAKGGSGARQTQLVGGGRHTRALHAPLCSVLCCALC